MSPPWSADPALRLYALPWLELLTRLGGRGPFLVEAFRFRFDLVWSRPATSCNAPVTLWRKACDMSFPLRASDARPTPVLRPARKTFFPASLARGMIVQENRSEHRSQSITTLPSGPWVRYDRGHVFFLKRAYFSGCGPWRNTGLSQMVSAFQQRLL